MVIETHSYKAEISELMNLIINTFIVKRYIFKRINI